MQNKKAFSFVEIIIVLSIIALLSVVGLSMQGASNQKAQNTKTVGHIGTINNSILTYLEEKKVLPEPKGNRNYFLSGSEYAHDESGSFGVHGFVTQNLLPKKYLNYLPLDPRTNQYYAYGKTNDDRFYEVAGVLNIDGQYESKVEGNYPGEDGPYSLIREYNGPNFVSEGSKYSFPYNPIEKVLVAQIDSFSGSLNISSDNYTINGNSNPEQVLEHTIVSGDTITVSAGGSASIFYSDGSQSVLGDTAEISVLAFANMEFKTEDNLLTNIQLALDSGTLWTKATNLNSDGSDFEVYTTDTAAAVRGTIFGIKKDKDSNESVLTVQQGTVEIKKIEKQNAGSTSQINNILELVKSIKEKKISKVNITIDGTTVINEGGNSVIKVIDPTIPKTIRKKDSINTINTTVTDLIEVKYLPFTTNINFEIDNINLIDLGEDNSSIEIIIPIKIIKKIVNSLAIMKDGQLYLTEIDNTQDEISLTGDTNFTKVTSADKVNKRIGLSYKNLEIEGGQEELSNIITANSKSELYLCKYNETIERLECSGKKEIKVKEAFVYDREKVEEEEEVKKDNLETIKRVEETKIIKVKEELDKKLISENGYGELYASAEFNEIGEIDLLGDVPFSTNQYNIIANTYNFSSSCNNESNIYNSFCKTDLQSGIFIDNSGSNEYLKYKGLDLQNKFTIQIRAKLDGTGTGTRYLFKAIGNKLYINNSGMFFKKDSTHIINNDLIKNSTVNSNFYTITASFDTDFAQNEFNISGNDITLKIKTFNKINNTNYFYLGSNGDSDQINNIIDYLRIYKN